MYKYLKKFKEQMPKWLEEFKKGEKPNFKEIFSSRLLFYPGSGLEDGQPIKTCVKSSCIHVFLYVDYGISRKELEDTLKTPGFKGYHIFDTIEITPQDFVPNGWHPHTNGKNINSGMVLKNEKPYCFMTFFERDENLTEEHGSKRFAVIFLFADGIATYDALFGNKNIAPPFIMVLQDHGFGGNYDSYGSKGLLEQIAINTNTYPQLIMLGSGTEIWNGYRKSQASSSIGGMHKNLRFLYEKE